MDERRRFVFASVGYGTGVALYLIFGIFAAGGGWVIWKTFLDLDSSRYPMQSFGDPFLRLFGVRMRHFINVAQSLQQFCTVAILIFSKALNIEQIAKSGLCFIAMMVVIMVVGMLGGFVRSLKKIGWIANWAVVMNVVNFIIW
jgi:amino acid permease